jgi:cytochrome c oxidase subunit II
MKTSFHAIVIGVAVFACGSGFRVSGASQSTPRRVEISAKRYAFEPSAVTLKKGEPVVLVIQSKDVEHGLDFYDLGLKLVVPKRGVGELKFTPDKEGDFVGHCAVFCGVGHAAMMLTLHVVD